MLLNTKYNLGESGTYDTSLVGNIPLYTLSRRETTHSSSSGSSGSSSSYDRASFVDSAGPPGMLESTKVLSCRRRHMLN